MAISILYNPQPMRLFEADGDFAAGAKGYFFWARTTTPLTVYTDAPLATPHTWPVVADAYGLLPPIYIAKGTEYKVRIEDSAGNILYAADGIDNPAEPTAGEGGGGGLVITASQIAQTGDFWWQPTTATRDGWVKSNGKTLSHPSGSGDSKSLDLQALWMFLWNNFPDSLCPVTPGGRDPSSALADWQAFKSIGTLDMRGRGAAGLDDMGASALNLIQKTTTIGTTNTSTAATVPSTTGLCAGMIVKSDSVPAGTTIVSVNSGTAITLSAAATVTNVSAVAQFSIFGDATKPGYGGGENAHTPLLTEMFAHNHTATVTDPGHFHLVTTDADTSNRIVGIETGAAGSYDFNLPSSTSGGTVGDSISANAIAAAKVTGVTVSNTAQGGSAAANLWTPTRLGTWFVKV